MEKRNIYKGHRYVPKIMGEWDQEEDYEGLSIVTYQGTSYTSKKRVPVGINILDEDYWVVTGNYNAQVENYRQEVREFDDRIGDNKVYIEKNTDQLTQIVNNVKLFGAVGDSVTDDTDAIQNAIDYVVSLGQGVAGNIFLPKGRYRTTKPIKFPMNSQGIKLYSTSNARIIADHTGNGIELVGSNSNYGDNIVEGIEIHGPNEQYPTTSSYVPASMGAGVYMEESYYNVFRDCKIYGFKYGVHMVGQSIKNRFEGRTYIRFNQIGVFMDGGASNANNFIGTSIRENREIGVYIYGDITKQSFPTRNNFEGCLIESNVPYPQVPNNWEKYGVGIKIVRSFDNVFTNTYSENHDVGILIGQQSQGNSFISHRFNQGQNYKHLDKILFDGSSIYNNFFDNLAHSITTDEVTVDITTGSVIYNNQFINSTGLSFSEQAYTNDGITIVNHSPLPSKLYSSKADRSGLLQATASTTQNSITQGDGFGQLNNISGVDGHKALNIRGYNMLTFGNSITEDTVISEIVGGKKGQIFILTNYQIANEIVIKNNNTFLKLKNNRDTVLKNYNDTLILHVNAYGRIVELGRSFKDHLNVFETITIGSINAGSQKAFTIYNEEFKAKEPVTVNNLGGMNNGLIYQGQCLEDGVVTVVIFNSLETEFVNEDARQIIVSQP